MMAVANVVFSSIKFRFEKKNHKKKLVQHGA